MKVNFDKKGNLTPYKKVELNYQDFKKLFVDSFEKDSTRKGLFNIYENYTLEFRNKISLTFTQWINGSFLTNKKNPRNIDLVSLVDYRIVERKESLIRNQFLMDSV